MLPAHSQCLGFLKEVKMLDNIFEHSLQVNKVAVFLAKKIKSNGNKVDVDLVDCGSLLHDIDKHLTFESGNHGQVGKKFLSEKGFPQVAEFCITHNMNFILDGVFPSLEHKIVYYADKRVNGNQVVSLQERFEYIRERYGSRSKDILQKILLCEKPLFELENELLKLAKVDSSLRGLK